MRFEALLDGVRAAPDEDAPRQVVADWLEQAGESRRARLIRLQLEAARVPRWDARHAALAAQVAGLLTTDGDAWRAALPTLPGVTWGAFERGFVAHATFRRLHDLVKFAPRCVAATPLRSVTFPWPGSRPKRPPRLDGVIEVTLVGGGAPGDLEWLLDSPLFATVRRLTVQRSGWGAAEIARLLALPLAGRLERLDLTDHGLDPHVPLELGAGDLPNLVELGLGIVPREQRVRIAYIGVETAILLARWPGLAHVRRLDLTNVAVGRRGLAALVSSPNVGALRALGLRDATGRDRYLRGRDTLAALAHATPALELDELDLSACHVTDLSEPALHDCTALRDLKALRACDGADVARMVGAPWWSGLRVLEADDIGHRDVAALLSSDLPHLHTLSLRRTDPRIPSSGVREQVRAARLPSLVRLDLDGHPLDP